MFQVSFVTVPSLLIFEKRYKLEILTCYVSSLKCLPKNIGSHRKEEAKKRGVEDLVEKLELFRMLTRMNYCGM